MNRQNRPVNLELTKFSFPIPAIVSISHRISGVLLFIGIAFGMYVLDLSLDSPAGFERAQALMSTLLAKLVALGVIAVLVFHFVAGIRHLVMDLGWADTLQAGRISSYLTFALAAVLIVMAGVWLW